MGVDPSVVQLLVKTDEDLKATNNEGDTPLHIASVKDARFVEALLKIAKEKGTLEDLLKTQDAQGRTPLHRAIFRNLYPKIVELLLEYGADATKPDKNMRTPFHYLAEAMSSYESTPVQNKEIEMQKFVDTANLLLKHKGDPTVQDDKGISAVDLAKGPYTEETFKKLIK